MLSLELAVMATANTFNKLSENSHTSPISGPTLWVSEWTQTTDTTETSAFNLIVHLRAIPLCGS